MVGPRSGPSAAGSFSPSAPIAAPLPELEPVTPPAGITAIGERLASHAGVYALVAWILLPAVGLLALVVYMAQINANCGPDGCWSDVYNEGLRSIWPSYLLFGLVIGALFTFAIAMLGLLVARGRRSRRARARAQAIEPRLERAKTLFGAGQARTEAFEDFSRTLERARRGNTPSETSLFVGGWLKSSGVLLLVAGAAATIFLLGFGALVATNYNPPEPFYWHLPASLLILTTGIWASVRGAALVRRGTELSDQENIRLEEAEMQFLVATRGRTA